ncbi:hypothetical protein GYA28_01785 [Candidatus Roizmanbacteria bacterium]|jgi:hypothetical protein|nr:hypothetical protein [Candidatus Roizmanbacteria bacterium]
MGNKNYTPIDDLIKKHKQSFVSIPKEAEPIPVKKDFAEVKQGYEQETGEEVVPFLKKMTETIKLPPDLKKIGLQAEEPSLTEISDHPSIKLPLSDDKIVSGMHAPVTSSLRWLATFAFYLLSKAHLGLKIVGGHAVRIIKK